MFRRLPALLPAFLPVLALFLVVEVGAQEDPASSSEPEAGTGLEVAEAAICTGVEDRAPVGDDTTFSSGVGSLYCFTDVRGAGEAQTIIHAWIHEGTTRARVELEVRGERWRTWSSKQILPAWTGQWQVKVLTSEGVVLDTLEFSVE